MRLINWIMLRSMKKRAKRMAKEVAKLYAESKSRNPNASEVEIIKDMVFNEETLGQISEESRKQLETCCETVQGFCYIIVLSMGWMKGLMTFRALQFTHFMDEELEAQGFPPQSR